MKPAGFENAQGILSAAYAKDGADPQWNNDPGMKKFDAFLDKYFPDANKIDGSVVYGYGAAQTLAKVLEMCGDDLTRANVMKQAASLKDFATGHPAARRQDQHLGHRLRPDRAAADAAVQGREVGTVRRHHQRRTEQLTANFAGTEYPRVHLLLKYSPLRPPSQGAFCCWEPAEGIECGQEPKALEVKNTDTVNRDQGDRNACYPDCDWGPFRPPSQCLPQPAAARSRRRNTTPAPPTPKSRSATSCPTADRPPPTA